ncbi:Utp14 protein-domain-containing protein [Diaporthe sp. PMI_573]|nr:Utp14 protein-domain-containing protein [Diaporthaceae sp. PMI_573]
MPGRQSHGRSLLGKSQSKAPKRPNQKSKAKARAHALDAFAIAGKQVQPDRMTRRGRDLELDPREAHRRAEDDEDDEEDDEDEDEGPRKKRPRQAGADDDDQSDSDGEGADGGSDSEGHEWHVGVNSDDDDSEIESDDAFGESDEEKFDGYAFGGGRAQKKKKAEEGSDDEDEDVGDDGESLGSDAIDLADALMQSSDEDDEEGSQGDTESGSDEGDSESDTDVDDENSESDMSDEEEVDPAKRAQLDKLLKSYADTDDKDKEADSGSRSNRGFSLQDLGVSEIRNPDIKRSIKRVKKEERAEAGKKGTSKKLDVPLARRRQDQLDRIAAYEQTNKTLDRWNDTVKQNRRADHLMFPLPDTLANAGLDNSELLPLSKKTAGTELEQTIMSIMEESGLGPASQSQKEQEKKVDANGEEQTISRSELKDLWAQRRKDREMQSREQKRSKRIKKIKSKTYRRVHRKERLGEEAKLHEEMKASGEIDSEDEREAAARRRALERVGAKHKDSKWAKMGSKAGRAAWDDDYRAGLTDMARRDEELRKRVEGRTGGSEDGSDATSSSGDEDGNSRLLKELDEDDEDEDEGPHANLMKLKFMQRAEAARKQENDGILAEIRRDLESGSEQEDEDDAEVQVGRRSYGLPEQKKRLLREAKLTAANNAKEKSSKGGLSNANIQASFATDTNDESPATVGAGAWSRGKSAVVERKKKKITGNRPEDDLELNVTTLANQPPKPSKTKSKTASKAAVEGLPFTLQTGDDSSDDEIHHPLAVRDIDLANRAFAGDEVVAEFEAEKEAIMSEDDEKLVDNTMPGWGSWAGEGVSKRALKRNKGKVMTKKEGIKRKDRKDAKLNRVIMNEKRNRKNEKFLASQLPHPFESRQQYERSLRLPVGPEWMTKESFQASTKPRVIVKQGIIAPMAKPTI